MIEVAVCIQNFGPERQIFGRHGFIAELPASSRSHCGAHCTVLLHFLFVRKAVVRLLLKRERECTLQLLPSLLPQCHIPSVYECSAILPLSMIYVMCGVTLF